MPPKDSAGIAEQQRSLSSREFAERWCDERGITYSDDIIKPNGPSFGPAGFLLINYGADGAPRYDLSTTRYNRDENKYISPKGKGSIIYSPSPDALREWEGADVVWIAEGEGKTLALAQLGLPTLGVRGCNSWHLKGTKELHPVLAQRIRPGDRINIVFDADWKDNDRVHRGLYDCMAAIRALGGIPLAVNVPAIPGQSNSGIDDWIAIWRHSSQDPLRSLGQLERLSEVSNPYIVNFKEPYPTAQNFLELVYGDNLVNWQGEFYRWVGKGWEGIDRRIIRKHVYKFIEHANQAANAGRVNSIMDAAEAIATVDIPDAPFWLDDTDVDPTLPIPFANGLLNPDTMELLPRTPEFFNLSWSDVEYDPEAECPLWVQFVNQIYPGDAAQQESLQEFMGYTLTNDTSQQKAVALIGSPRSGKGTITTILEKLLGPEGSTSTQWGTLGERFGLMNWIGKRAGIIPDARNSGRNNSQSIVERILTITGEDSQSIDRKFLSPWRGRLTTRIWLISNQVPATRDTGAAFVKRFIVLSHQVSFLGKEDVALKHKLMDELPGILNWALTGLHRLRSRGYFLQPEAGKELIDEWERMNSPMLGFIRECCELGPGLFVPKADLRFAYAQYLNENEIAARLPGEAAFTKDLRSALGQPLGTSQHSLGGSRLWCFDGIALKEGQVHKVHKVHKAILSQT